MSAGQPQAAERWEKLRRDTLEQQATALSRQITEVMADLEAARVELGDAMVDLRRFSRLKSDVFKHLARREITALQRSPILSMIEAPNAGQLTLKLAAHASLENIGVQIQLQNRRGGPWLSIAAPEVNGSLTEHELESLDDAVQDPVFQALAKAMFQVGYGDLLPLAVTGLLLRQRRSRGRVAARGLVSDFIENRAYQISAARRLTPEQNAAEGHLTDAIVCYSSACQELALLQTALAGLEDERKQLNAAELRNEYERLCQLPLLHSLQVQDRGQILILTNVITVRDELCPPVLRRLGAFRIQIDLTRGLVKVFNQDPLLAAVNGGVQHPHVNADGNPCFGEASWNIQDLFATAALADLVAYVMQFIGTVNHLSVFRKASGWPPA